MEELDCSFGEGGGQIVRTALALAALTGKSIKLKNIRAKRPKPGLMPQHLTAVKTLASICGAELKGAYLGSENLTFIPKKIHSANLTANIGTAGSTSLLIQQVLPVSLAAYIKLRVLGGTDVNFAPSAKYLQKVTFSFLSKMGAKISLDIISRGYFPKGKGSVIFQSEPSFPLKPLNLTSRGELISIHCFSHCAGMPSKVAADMAKIAKKYLQDFVGDFEWQETIEAKSESKEIKGLGIDIFANYRNCVLGASYSAPQGTSADSVAKKAAFELVNEINSLAPFDSHMIDQIIPFLALAQGKSMVYGKMTDHTKTNIEITERLLSVKFDIKEDNGFALISVDGVSFTNPSL
ncbi:MAG: RNA 3'-terminal phosphate cyclase [Candidatus Diapherotrites archaeon]